jgi:hypothetical protein
MPEAIDPAAQSREIVLDVFRSCRAGHLRDHAFLLAGRVLGIRARRVRSFVEGHVPRVFADEWLHLRRKYREFLDRERARLEHEAEMQRLRCAQLDADDARDGLA